MSDPVDIIRLPDVDYRANLIRAIEAAAAARDAWWERYADITPAINEHVAVVEHDLENALCEYLSDHYDRERDRGGPGTLYSAVRYRGTVYASSWYDECPHTVARIRPEDVLDIDGGPPAGATAGGGGA
jgi:hypothetical protein